MCLTYWYQGLHQWMYRVPSPVCRGIANVAAVETAKALLGMDGLREMVEIKKDSHLPNW